MTSSLTLQEYQTEASETDRTRTTKTVRFLLLGLFGEIGTLLDEVKKKQRDSGSYSNFANNVIEELGDVLWYLAVVAARCNLALSAMAGPVEPGQSFSNADRFFALRL